MCEYDYEYEDEEEVRALVTGSKDLAGAWANGDWGVAGLTAPSPS